MYETPKSDVLYALANVAATSAEFFEPILPESTLPSE